MSSNFIFIIWKHGCSNYFNLSAFREFAFRTLFNRIKIEPISNFELIFGIWNRTIFPSSCWKRGEKAPRLFLSIKKVKWKVTSSRSSNKKWKLQLRGKTGIHSFFIILLPFLRDKITNSFVFKISSSNQSLGFPKKEEWVWPKNKGSIWKLI